MAGANTVQQGPVNASSDELTQIKEIIRGVIDKLYESVRIKLNASDVKKMTKIIKSRKAWNHFGLTESELKNIKTVKKFTRLLRDQVCLENGRINVSSCLHNLWVLMSEVDRPEIQPLIDNAEQELMQFGELCHDILLS